MIELTRLNDKAFYINSDLIETIEETPDTVITLTTGRKLVVKNPAEEIIAKVVAFRYLCFHDGRARIITGNEEMV